jgi:hypothetical protein
MLVSLEHGLHLNMASRHNAMKYLRKDASVMRLADTM